MPHHQRERSDRPHQNASRNLSFHKPSFNVHDEKHHLTILLTLWGETQP